MTPQPDEQREAMSDEQIHALSVLLVSASGRTTPLTMAGAESILRLIIEAPNSPFAALSVQPVGREGEKDAAGVKEVPRG